MSRSPGRRRLSGAVGVALALTLAGGAVPALADSAHASFADVSSADVSSAGADAAGDGVAITSGALSVSVAKDFPRVLSYTDRASGARLLGSTSPVTEVTLNGKAYKVGLKAAPKVTAHRAAYTLVFPGLPGVEIDAALDVAGRATTFKVTAVRDTEAFRLGTLDIPGHDLISVGSADAGAETAFTRLDTDSTRTADVFGKVTASTAPDASPVGASYAIVNTGSLAAAFESNSTYDKPAGATNGDNARFWHQARKGADGSVRVGVWSGQWTYRGDGAPAPERELPWAKVVVTPDANGDRTVDWQDGAVAFHDIGIKVKGGEKTPDRVITHIPYNFASQATHPFLRTLDDVKRISLSTDGLGQLSILKGYASEGHDSAHPDYGGNINKRAGGLKDLNKLLKGGKKWGSTFGVHVNATEAYAEANAFDDKLVDKSKPGWNWLGQSYYIDQRHDINSGNLARRFQQLRDETDPNLSLIYIDVYYTHGWIADRTLTELKNQGWDMATEFGNKFERQALWSHWANDLDYGPKTNKGLNSKIIRFIRNGEKDVWNDDPVLGQTALVGFEGWTGENDWNDFSANVWERNLPAKFLQHYRITDWDKNDVTFTGGVRGTVTDGKREVSLGGSEVIDGDSYLLPWKSRDSKRQDKLYHWSKKGGTSTWTVPRPFAGTRQFTYYKLTDNGRVEQSTVTAKDGKVTLTAAAGQPYVLYPDHAPQQADPDWGQGGKVKDPGFNDIALADWKKTGPVTGDRDALGHRGVTLGGDKAAAIEQRVTGLTPGKGYSASVNVEVEPGRTRPTTIAVGGEKLTVDRSTAKNYIAGDERHGTYYQRVEVHFTAPRNGSATLRISAAGDGDAKVGLDDVRIVENDPATKKGTVAYDDFDAVDQGWGPFVKGESGGENDPRTHIAQKHAPYTQAGWNGKLIDDVIGDGESLKSHEENEGLVYRTTPASVTFEAGHAYKVEFDYQNSHAGAYQWTTGYDTVTGGEPTGVTTRRTALPQQRTTGHFDERVVGGCGDVWTGLTKAENAPEGADFVLDNFTVTDLGATDERSACATLGLTSDNATLEPGSANKVTAAFANHEATAAKNVEVTLDVPEGWKAEAAGATTFDSVAAGAEATATWNVTPPADAEYRSYPITAEASYEAGGDTKSLTDGISIHTLAPPPTEDTWVSDMDWVSADNGWGPPEKDLSNGEVGSGDGQPISIGGTAFPKGLGTHAPADVKYYLGGGCEAFTAQVGVDDAQKTAGSVQFSVLADGRKVAESPLLKASDSAYKLDADVSGAKYVELVVGDGGDGNGNDHASWGGAKWLCG
ncbi:endo-alpha-N-acetylgalactosaminidase family protein [Streptomyces sp. NPDC057681]|uniref:endo-alpha-N-acetylgalactosaminidase family protein n=1 Tax=Streptomyces sp. NPDC057681 TaxID=3346209 RepID=UPI0036759710